MQHDNRNIALEMKNEIRRAIMAPNTYFSGCPLLLLHIHQDAAIENYNYLGNGILYSWSHIVSVGSTFSTNGKMSYCSKASELCT